VERLVKTLRDQKLMWAAQKAEEEELRKKLESRDEEIASLKWRIEDLKQDLRNTDLFGGGPGYEAKSPIEARQTKPSSAHPRNVVSPDGPRFETTDAPHRWLSGLDVRDLDLSVDPVVVENLAMKFIKAVFNLKVTVRSYFHEQKLVEIDEEKDMMKEEDISRMVEELRVERDESFTHLISNL
jgi:hypothetical protein